MPENPINERVAFSNSICLAGKEWLCVALVAAALVAGAPSLWKYLEPFDPDPDYRIPHKLSNDYWLFERFAGVATSRYDAVILGDSVVWGEYVLADETLSHYLNLDPATGKVERRFANLGLGGAHPLALAGLIEHYGASLANTRVLLQCNPLWMSSLKSDLQDDRTDVNHPRLIPQFVPHIPAYPVPWFPDDPRDKQKISHRLGILVEQRVGFSKWTNHIQQAYYDEPDVLEWVLRHPYKNPLTPLSSPLQEDDGKRRHPPLPWNKTGKSKVDYDWIDLDTSLQWSAFRRAVETLQRRGNRVFVLVGPFNENMLTPESLTRYRKTKGAVSAWLKERDIPHAVPDALPSHVYGDASHPLAAGYAQLARQLADDPAFQRVIAGR